MIFLSTPAIRYAVDMCFEEPRYNILVVTKYQRSVDTVAEVIQEQLMNEEYRTIHAAGMRRFEFENGSQIRVISANERIPGYRANLVVADIGIDREGLHRARSCETLFWQRYNEQHHDDDWLPF